MVTICLALPFNICANNTFGMCNCIYNLDNGMTQKEEEEEEKWVYMAKNFDIEATSVCTSSKCGATGEIQTEKCCNKNEAKTYTHTPTEQSIHT